MPTSSGSKGKWPRSTRGIVTESRYARSERISALDHYYKMTVRALMALRHLPVYHCFGHEFTSANNEPTPLGPETDIAAATL